MIQELCHRKFLAVAIVTHALLVPIASAAPAGWKPVAQQDWLQPARPDSGGGDAIILLSRGVVEDRSGSYRTTISRRLRIFTASGREAAHVEIDYLDGSMKLQDVRARSVRPDGSSIELDAGDLIPTIVLKHRGEAYKRLSFIVPGAEPGSIVEYEYTISGKYDGLLTFPWDFQSEFYTCTSSFEWWPSKSTEIRNLTPTWTLRRLPSIWCTQSCEPDCTSPKVVRLTVHSVRGNRDEIWSPPHEETGPRVVTSYVPRNMKSYHYWSMWKRWLDTIAEAFEQKSGLFIGIVDRARQINDDPARALEAVHRWLQMNVRSLAELSWDDLQRSRSPGSFMGRSPNIEDLIRRRQGSPYEIHLAFASAARRLGFESIVALVRDRRSGAFESDIVGAPPADLVTGVRQAGGGVWTFHDPASRFALFGNVPWYLRGGAGLVSGTGHELIVDVDADAGVPGTAEWMLDLTMDAHGMVWGGMRGTLAGERAREMQERLWLTQPSRWKDVLRDELSPDRSPDFVIEPPSLGATPDSALVIRGSLPALQLGSNAGGLVTLPISKLGPWWIRASFPDAHRTQNIFFTYPRRQSIQLDLALPAGAEADYLPPAARFKNQVGEWHVSWERSTTGIRMRREVKLVTAEMPARQYAQVRAFFSGLDQADRENVLIRVP